MGEHDASGRVRIKKVYIKVTLMRFYFNANLACLAEKVLQLMGALSALTQEKLW